MTNLRSNILIRFVRSSLLLTWCVSLLFSGVFWLYPIEAAQSWAVNRAGPDDFSRFEAFTTSTITVWLFRWSATGLAGLLSVAWWKRKLTIPFAAQVVTGFWESAAPAVVDQEAADLGASGGANVSVMPSNWLRIRRTVARLLVIAWLLLSVAQFANSIQRRVWDWPVYGLRSGMEVLPNISASNREVIRFLQQATPPGSKILIFSDQKLYFLSYYLLPRRIYHPMHPDSEFVIAQAYNQRELAAYRASEIDPARIRRLNPDYILEYFEGATHLSDTNLMRDRSWIEFERRRYGPGWKPQFLVDLRSQRENSVP